MRIATALLRRPGIVALTLAAWLVRGGIALLVLPIVTLPSTVDITAFFGPNAITPAGPSAWLVLVVSVLLGSAALWLVAGWLASAAFELAAIQAAATSARRVGAGDVVRAWAIRIVCLAPLVVVLAIAGGAIGRAAYDELILPGDLATPLLLRVVLRVPGFAAAVAAAWLAGELIGGLAIRSVALRGDGVAQALGGSIELIVRHPLSVGSALAGMLASTVATIGAALLLLVAARGADLGGGLTGAFGSTSPVDRRIDLLLIVLLAAAWLAAILLVGIGAAVRSVAWTFTLERLLGRREGEARRKADERG
jgi:hypothetical protein